MDPPILRRIWKQAEADYGIGIVNSERCLQACLYRAARDQLCDVKIFVEPGLLYEPRGGYELVPDLILCKDNAVLSIIEIKFVPHWYPNYKRDVSKFNRLWERKKIGHRIPIEPKTGRWTDTKLWIQDDTCFVFAVIAQHDAAAVDFDTVAEKLLPPVRERFVLLSGRIGGEHGPKPKFCVSPSEF